MSSKPTILIFCDWYKPAFKAGGPVQSIANIVAHLHPYFDFKIITGDRDLHDDRPYTSVALNTWCKVDHAEVYYIDQKSISYKKIAAMLKETKHDVVYLNSVFSVPFTLYVLMAVKTSGDKAKVILAPRGMLAKEALQIKATKKMLFLSLAKGIGIYRNVCWHASTPLEKEEIQAIFGPRAEVKVAINLGSKRDIIEIKRIKSSGHATYAFLSRIAIKKNLQYAIEVLSKSTRGNIVFDIYGVTDEHEYRTQCEERIKQLTSSSIAIRFKGEVAHHNISEVLSNYHFTILPTRNENYGHSIVESWACGCPVLISTETPWRNLEEQNIGWDIALNEKSKWISVIEKSVDMNQDEYDRMSAASYNFARLILQNQQSIDSNINLFK
ncbi:MAG: glycosyltransferase [Bacteroidetes bacterium]|nr:glycosyltransferase [Bacteroidota bacterium]